MWRGGDGDGRGEEGSYIGDWDQYIQYIYIYIYIYSASCNI